MAALLLGSTLAVCALIIYVASGATRAVVRRETEVVAAASQAASTDSCFGEQRVRAAAEQLFRDRHAGKLKGTIRVHYVALDRPGGRVGVRISSGGIEEYWTLVRSDGSWSPDTVEDRKARKQMLARPIVT